MQPIKVLIGPSTFAAENRAPLDRLIGFGCRVIENPFKRKLTKSELKEILSEDVAGLIAGLEPLDREVLAHPCAYCGDKKVKSGAHILSEFSGEHNNYLRRCLSGIDR
jgi:hypothetical protein